MKYLIILLLTFYSCRTDSQFIVEKIESNHTNRCDYWICQTGNGPSECITIKDTCGLYQVGDTLTLIKK